jgi:glutamate--cysteine ligase
VSGAGSDDLRPARGVDDLVAHLASGEKPRERWRVGTEHEKIGLYARDFRRVPHGGERGIGALLARIAALDGWTPVSEDGALIALEKGAASITLEPGGQLELSGAPLTAIHDTCAEFSAHLELVRRVSEPLGIVWLSLGSDPVHGLADVPQMPKARYAIMREYLPRRGDLALHMMHLTATVQANFDYASEADMVAKLRTALAATPVVSAIFANSSIYEGKPSGFVSRRLHVWRHTDPDRCGIPPFVFEPGFGYRRWVEWALDVPMFFLVRGGRYRPARGTTFRRFLAEGFEGERATIGDFDRHLTTLFPDVRLKRVIEVRGADAVPSGLICALPALWKGILYDAGACRAAWDLAAGWSQEEREAAMDAVARAGLAARIAGRPALELAHELVEIASEGLRRIGAAGALDPDERGFLEPIRAQLALGKSPGEVVLERWEGEWNRSLERLIEYARY